MAQVKLKFFSLPSMETRRINSQGWYCLASVIRLDAHSFSELHEPRLIGQPWRCSPCKRFQSTVRIPVICSNVHKPSV